MNPKVQRVLDALWKGFALIADATCGQCPFAPYVADGAAFYAGTCGATHDQPEEVTLCL